MRCGHACGKREARLGAMELGQSVGHGDGRRVVDARVRVARLAVTEDFAQLLRVSRAEGDCLIDRDGVGSLIDFRRACRCMDGARAETAAGSWAWVTHADESTR